MVRAKLEQVLKKLAIFAAVAASTAQGSSINLGAANEFNLFVLGNHTPGSTDSAGRVAVMGDAVYKPFAPAQSNNGQPISSGQYNLIVGGDLSWTTGGSMGIGDIFVGGNATVTNVGNLKNLAVNGDLAVRNETINGKLTVGGAFTNNGGVGGSYTVTKGASASPVDFAAAKQHLESAPQFWGQLGGQVNVTHYNPNPWTDLLSYQTSTGITTYNAWGQFALTGSDPSLNVFYVPSFHKHPTKGINLNGMSINVPSGSTVLINSDQTNVVFGSYGQSYTGATANNVLFNFYNAVSVNAQYFSGSGSLLAPLADYAGGGYWNGTVVAKSVSGSTQFHNYLFQGGLPDRPDPDAVPEPSPIILLSSGVVAMWLGKRWRR